MSSLQTRMTTKQVNRPTGNSYDGLGLLASNEEDHVPLRRVDIVILEEEKFVDAILLQR